MTGCAIRGCPKPKQKGRAYCAGHRVAINRYVLKLHKQVGLVQVMAIAVEKWQKGNKGCAHKSGGKGGGK